MSRMSGTVLFGNVRRTIWYVPGGSLARSPQDIENVPGMADDESPRLAGVPSGNPPSTDGAPAAPVSAGAVTYVVNSSAGAMMKNAGLGFVFVPSACL